METRGGDDDVGLEQPAGLQQDALSVKRSIRPVTTEAFPAAIARKRSPSGTKASRCCQGRYAGVKWVSTS